MGTLNQLEDRVLVLQDQVDVLTKEYNPNEARDYHGRWSTSGATRTVIEHVRTARGWLTAKRVGEAVNLVASHLPTISKQALAHAVAAAATYHSNSGPDYDAVQASVLVLADKMEVSAHQAREHVVGALQKLRAMRMKELGKVWKEIKDSVIEQIDKAINMLDNMKFDDKAPAKKEGK